MTHYFEQMSLEKPKPEIDLLEDNVEATCLVDSIRNHLSAKFNPFLMLIL